MSTSHIVEGLHTPRKAADLVESFEHFYRTEYSRTIAIARAMVADRESAEDLAQEALVTAHRHWDRISRYDNPSAWLRRVLINKANSLRRRVAAEVRALARIRETPDFIDDLTPSTAEVWDTVRRLPRRQREAIVLHYVAQLDMNEIGEAMGCSTGTVKSHLHRARQTLSHTLADWREQG